LFLRLFLNYLALKSISQPNNWINNWGHPLKESQKKHYPKAWGQTLIFALSLHGREKLGSASAAWQPQSANHFIFVFKLDYMLLLPTITDDRLTQERLCRGYMRFM
jgi:hypothetical protein